MSDESMAKYKRDAKEKTDKTDTSVRVLDATQRDGAETADKAGAVKSELSDINAEIRRIRGGILKSIETAARSDASQVKDRVAETNEHRRKVDGVRDRTSKEKQKAEAIRPKDKRMAGGSEMTRTLEKTSSDLSELSSKESKVATTAERKRHELETRLHSAIERNR